MMLYSVSSKQTNNNNNKREAIVGCHPCDTGCDCLALEIEKERRKKEGRKRKKEAQRQDFWSHFYPLCKYSFNGIGRRHASYVKRISN